MKSFFDFIGRTEATRRARRWSWNKNKRGFSCFIQSVWSKLDKDFLYNCAESSGCSCGMI
ncbi:hypothetical protein [Mesobacillus boroniphilus]|uniref:hypothetical protein n=1 Tax=Mesobacillus boroniphilus TaxID=308892 RepID=UPI0011DD7C61|nr:hypothetical protein [Mesobacillus boroniphilus]